MCIGCYAGVRQYCTTFDSGMSWRSPGHARPSGIDVSLDPAPPTRGLALSKHISHTGQRRTQCGCPVLVASRSSRS